MRLGSSYTDSSKGTTRLFLAIVVLALVLLAFIVGRVTAPKGSGGEHLPEEVAESAAGPEASQEADAAIAAAEFARIIVGPSGDASTYLDQMKSIAAPAWRQRAQELGAMTIEFVRDRYGEGGTVDFEPIRYRIRSHSQSEAVVDIWGVVLASGPKIGGIEESWITGTINLILVGSEWKVAGQSSEGGPTPELLRTEQGSTVAEIITEFDEYNHALDS